jgi:hypothetical protein
MIWNVLVIATLGCLVVTFGVVGVIECIRALLKWID